MAEGGRATAASCTRFPRSASRRSSAAKARRLSVRGPQHAKHAPLSRAGGGWHVSGNSLEMQMREQREGHRFLGLTVEIALVERNDVQRGECLPQLANQRRIPGATARDEDFLHGLGN